MTEPDYSKTAYMFYPANWPNDVEEPHCTIVYFGETGGLNFGPLDIVAVFSGAPWFEGFLNLSAKTKGSLTMFGEEHNIPVVELDEPLLHTNSDQVRAVLRAAGMSWDQTHPDYRPHVSVGPSSASEAIPERIILGHPVLGWGNERYSL